MHIDGGLQYRGGIVVPWLADLRKKILKEFHCSRFIIHLGGTKMYHDLCCLYYWSGMKQQVGTLFVGVSRVNR